MIDKLTLEIATDWWVDQISGHKMNWDNGAQNEGTRAQQESAMTMMFMANQVANAARGQTTQKQYDTFKESLIRQLTEESERKNEIVLSCDYGPGKFLAEAATEAKILFQVFPCKTVMWIEPNSVQTKLGYGKEIRVIL